MDLGKQAQALMDMRVSQAAEYKHIEERYERLMKFAL